jgi:tetratricopeptide (TPR) repeat protein
MSTGPTIPADPQFGMMLRRLVDSRQWERALEVARDWLGQDPESVDAHLAAGQALVNLKQYAAANVHLAKALAARPNNTFALRLASIASFHEGKMARADELIRRAIELQPNDAMHWYHLAWMRFRQGLFDAAEKHARRALELQPESADTINLIAICQRGNPETQYRQYLRALEIDPQNAVVHSNLGSYYMNCTRDYAAAEASFRRALEINPTDRSAQKNLFTVLRRRDRIYRVMTLPMELLRAVSWRRRSGIIARLACIALLIFAGQYFLGLLAFWLLLVWPMMKVYEYLTLSDIRAKAGVVGARRGGWRGFHRWPLSARLGVFALLVVCFWGGICLAFVDIPAARVWIIAAFVIALAVWYLRGLTRWWGQVRRRSAAIRAEKKFRRQQAAAGPY